MTRSILSRDSISIPLAALCFVAVIGWPLKTAAGVSGKTDQINEIVLQLKWRHQFQFAGYYIAKEKGFYRREGLKVTIKEAKNQEEVTQSVLNGKAQFGIGTSDLVIARANKKKVVALAAIFQHSPLILLTLKKDNIRNPADLAGKTLMLEPHSAELIAYLKDEGISLDQLQLLSHTFDAEPLMTGDVHAMSAYVTDEPYILIKNGIQYRALSPRSDAIDFYSDVLFTTEDMISNAPKIVHRFLQSSLKGWDYAFKNVETTLDLITQKYKMRHSREHLKYEADKMRELVITADHKIGRMSRERWQHIAHTYARIGMMPKHYSLKGFLYESNRRIMFRWLLAIIIGVAVIVATLILVGLSEWFAKIRGLISNFFKKNESNTFPKMPGEQR